MLIIQYFLLLSVFTSLYHSKITKKVHKKKKTFPDRLLPQMKEVKKFTTQLPQNTKSGDYGFRGVREIFFDKKMSYPEMKILFSTIDSNKDDNEWSVFFDLYLDPFQKCDKDNDFLLAEKETAECLKEGELFANIRQFFPDEEAVKLLHHYMDYDKLNFVRYLWLRRLNHAWTVCSDGPLLSPSRIVCAIQITSPRTRHLTSAEEKGLFTSAIVLSKGFHNGTNNGLVPNEYVQIAYMYNYFSDYEIQFSEKIRKDEVYRAIQEGVLPHWLTRQTADIMFDQKEHEIGIGNFFGIFYSSRLFFAEANGLFLEYSGYTNLIKSNRVPDRLKEFLSKIYIPTAEEIELASKNIFRKESDTNYFSNYNNMIFLQKKKKTKLRTNLRDQADQDDPSTQLEKLEFQTESEKVAFHMFDNYRNETIFIKDFYQFIRISFNYMQLQPFGIQRLSFESQEKNQVYFNGIFNCFTYNLNEYQLQTQLYDFFTEHQEYSMNYKQYLAWFRIQDGATYMSAPGLPFRTSVRRTAQLFKDLGFRFSRFNQSHSLKGYNKPLGERNFQYWEAFKIALQEDQAAYLIKLNMGTYVHRDFKVGDPNPTK